MLECLVLWDACHAADRPRACRQRPTCIPQERKCEMHGRESALPHILGTSTWRKRRLEICIHQGFASVRDHHGASVEDSLGILALLAALTARHQQLGMTAHTGIDWLNTDVWTVLQFHLRCAELSSKSTLGTAYCLRLRDYRVRVIRHT